MTDERDAICYRECLRIANSRGFATVADAIEAAHQASIAAALEVTEAMVERACNAYLADRKRLIVPETSGPLQGPHRNRVPTGIMVPARNAMRAALTAALDTNKGNES